MKTVMAYLRYGVLYYHYCTELSAEGPGSGEYGPINHMFPITPVELHEGYIIGKERIITAVSGTFAWRNAQKPTVLVFDVTGMPTQADAKLTQKGGEWLVELKIEDWEQIAVVE